MKHLILLFITMLFLASCSDDPITSTEDLIGESSSSEYTPYSSYNYTPNYSSSSTPAEGPAPRQYYTKKSLTLDNNGTETGSIVYVYNLDSLLVQEVTFEERSSAIRYEYDDQKRLIREYENNNQPRSTQYSYNGGRLSQKMKYVFDNISEIYDYYYLSDTKYLEVHYLYNDGNGVSYPQFYDFEICTLNANGDLIERIRVAYKPGYSNSPVEVYSTIKYEYDGDRIISSITSNSEGMLNERSDYVYDDKDRLVTLTYASSDSDLNFTTTYLHDDQDFSDYVSENSNDIIMTPSNIVDFPWTMSYEIDEPWNTKLFSKPECELVEAPDLWYETPDCIGCILDDVAFDGANSTGVGAITLGEGDFSCATFKGVSMRFFDFKSDGLTNLIAADFTDASFNSDFQDAVLAFTIFDGARINTNTLATNGKIYKSSFIGADFTGNDLYLAELIGLDFTDANFTNANLTSTVFVGSIVDNADFTGADLSGAYWIDGRQCAAESIGVCK